MNRCLTTLCALMVFCCLLLPAVPKASAELTIGVGDWWKYAFEMSENDMTMDGSIKTKIVDKETVGEDEVFLVKMTGSGDASGALDNLPVSGDLTFTGYERRHVSNYSLVWRSFMWEMTISAPMMTASMEAGEIQDADPCQDDYIGDDTIVGGMEVESRCTMYSEEWANAFGVNESSSDEYVIETILTVADAKQTVSVPAGTFECWKITVEVNTFYGPYFSDTETSTYYYSEEVGNYVKMDGDELYGGIFSSLELDDYSGGGGGISGFLSDYWWVVLLIIAAIVVVVLLAAMGRRGRRSPVPMPPQPQPAYPVPSPGVPPAPPPDTGGPSQGP